MNHVQILKIKYEKERNKIFDKSIREKITYVEACGDNDNFLNYQDLDVNKEEDKISMAKLQPRPPCTCQMLKLQEKHKFPNSKYSFNVTMTHKIFDVLLKDKQIVLSDDHKIPSFEQRKGKDIVNSIMFFDIGLIIVYVLEI